MENITNIKPLSLFDESKQAKEGQANFRANASYSWSWLIEHTKELNSAFNDFNFLVVQTIQTAKDINFDVDVLEQAKEHIDLSISNIEQKTDNIHQIAQDITNKYNSLKEHNQATKTSLGLKNVDNTADIDKPLSNAVIEALKHKTNDDIKFVSDYYEIPDNTTIEVKEALIVGYY